MSKLFDLQDTDLLPQLGGALSLFLGIAIIMAFEIFELIGDLLVALFFQGNWNNLHYLPNGQNIFVCQRCMYHFQQIMLKTFGEESLF